MRLRTEIGDAGCTPARCWTPRRCIGAAPPFGRALPGRPEPRRLRRQVCSAAVRRRGGGALLRGRRGRVRAARRGVRLRRHSADRQRHPREQHHQLPGARTAVRPGSRRDAGGGPAPEGLDVSSIAVDPAGTRIAVAGRSERRVMIWDRGAGDVEDLPGAPGDLGRLAWSPDGSGPHGVSPSRGVFSFDGTAWAHCLDHLRHALVRARHRPGARSPVLRPCCSRCSRSRCGQSVWIAVAPLRTSGPHPGSGPSSSAVSSSWPR